MKYRIELRVPEERYVAAAKHDVKCLCGSEATVTPATKDGHPYYIISGMYEGDPEKYYYLAGNWNTLAHPGDALYGTIGFYATKTDERGEPS